MPTLAHLAQSINALGPAASLAGREGITGDVGGGLLDYDTAQAQLQQALKYDPNAYLERAGGDDGSAPITADQGPGYTQYLLHMDNSKLPKFQGQLNNVSQTGGWSSVDLTGQNQAGIAIDPSQVINDPNYGAYTMPSNIKANPNDAPGSGIMGDLQKYMPGVVGAVMSLGSGGLMSPSLVQAAAAAGDGNWQGVEHALPGLGMSLLGGQLGGSFLPADVTSGLNMIKPYVSLGQGIYGASKPGASPMSALGPGLTLAQLLGGAGGR